MGKYKQNLWELIDVVNIILKLARININMSEKCDFRNKIVTFAY